MATTERDEHSGDASGPGHPTRFPELNALLADFTGSVASILGADLVGAYVVGSFALGGGDLSSDCDFLVVTQRQLTDAQERALRDLHDEIPTRPGHWEINLEGSYAPQEDLESLDRLGREWLHIPRGWREMQWSDHCNVLDVRWVLRERGITLIGPDPRTFAAEVPPGLLREAMRPLIDDFLPQLRTWANFDYLWTQRYIVETVCRMLYSFETGKVTYKRAALEWGRHALPGEWHGLIEQAIADRAIPWNDPARPGSFEPSIAFADYAKERVRVRS